MLIHGLVALIILATVLWVAATRFVRSRGYPGWYLTYIGAGSTNPTWQSLAEIRQSGRASDRRTARRLWRALLATYALFFVVFIVLAHSYLSGPAPG